MSELERLCQIAREHFPTYKIRCDDLTVPKLKRFLNSIVGLDETHYPLRSSDLRKDDKTVLPTSSKEINYAIIAYSTYRHTKKVLGVPEIAKIILSPVRVLFSSSRSGGQLEVGSGWSRCL